MTELHSKLTRCFRDKEPNPLGPLLEGLYVLVPECTRLEKRFLAKLLPRLHSFPSLFSDMQRKILFAAKRLNIKHRALAPFHTLEKELQLSFRQSTTPGLGKQLTAIHQHYQKRLRDLLTTANRESHLKPKAQLFYHGHFLINRTLAKRLLSCDELGKITRFNTHGSRPVVQHHGIHFKIGAEGYPELDTAGEYAVSSLCHLLSPDKMIAAPTATLSIRMPKIEALVQASLTVGCSSEKPSAMPLNELLSVLESFHLLKDHFGSNLELERRWKSLIHWAQGKEQPRDPRTVLKNYLKWMKCYPSMSRATEFTEENTQTIREPRFFKNSSFQKQLSLFYEYLPTYPIALWINLLNLLKKEPLLMKGRSIRPLLRLGPSLIWILKLFPSDDFDQIARELPVLLDKVDRDALSRLFLASLIVNPHDGKADNYMVTIARESGRIRDQGLRIVGIDNDLAFEPPILKAGDIHHIHTKCLLYALPPKLLKSTIPKQVREDVCRLDTLDLLLEWIGQLDQHQMGAQRMAPLSLKLPIQALAKAFQKIGQIQHLLSKEITLEKLFCKIEPVVFYGYQEACRRGEGVSDAFALLDWKSGLSLEELFKEKFTSVEQDGRSMSLRKAYTQAAQGDTQRTSLAAATQAALKEASLFLKPRHLQQIANLSFVDQLRIPQRSPQKLLLSSIKAWNLPLARLALLNGADPNLRDEANRPSLYHLIPFSRDKGGEQILKCLTNFGADLEWKHPERGETLLDFAADNSLIQEFIALIRCGAGRDCRAVEALAFAQAFIEAPGMREALEQLEKQCHRVAWLQDLALLLTSQHKSSALRLQRARLQTGPSQLIDLTQTYLHPSVAAQIGITAKKCFPVKRKNQYGRHTIASIECEGRQVTFKDRPEMAGNEFLVSSLHEKIIGHGAPQSELFKARDIYGKSYPVLVSQTIKGTNFHDILYGPKSAEKLAKLDLHRLHNMMLMAILTNPEDGKSEQYMYSRLNDESFQLTCIDNDHAFVKPFDGKQLMVKCILFCLDQMQEPIDPQTRNLFLSLNAEETLKSWLLQCESQNKLYTALFDEPERQAQVKKSERDPIIIQMFLPERATAKIFEKIGRIQDALADEAVTPLEILLSATPELGRYYQQLFSQRYASPQERWQDVKRVGGYTTDASGGEHTRTSTLDLLKHFGIEPAKLLKLNPAYFIDQAQSELIRLKTEAASLSAITNDLLQGRTGSFKALLLDYSREKALKLYPFTQNPSRDQKILNAILSIKPSFFHLNFSKKEIFSFEQSWNQIGTIFTFSPFLKSLTLDRCRDVTEQFIWSLSTLCLHLTRLSLAGCPRLKKVWSVFEWLTFPSLQQLNLQGSSLQRFHVRAVNLTFLDLSQCKKLTHLSLDLPALKRGKLDGCSKLSLKELRRVAREVKNAQITATQCPSLKKIKARSLIEQSLSLLRYPIETLNEKLARGLNTLIFNQEQILRLSYDDIGDSGAQALGQALQYNSSLTDLDLRQTNIGSSGAQALGQALRFNSSLEWLCLSCNSIGSSGAQALGQALRHNSSLIGLSLNRNNIGVGGVQAIAHALQKNSSLTKLGLRCTDMGVKDALALEQMLRQNSSLTKLYIGSTVRGIGQALRYNSSLKHLKLRDCGLGLQDSVDFGSALKDNRTLLTLALKDCAMGMGIESIGRGLRHNRTLLSLTFRNCITGPRLEQFLEELQYNSSLTFLELSIDHHLTDSFGKALSNVLQHNSSLEALHLSNNEIGDSSAQALGQALQYNSSLIDLNLRFNYIGDSGAQALGQALQHNSSLIDLNLRDNNIGDSGAQALGQALQHNSSLIDLNLRDNNIGDSGAQALGRGLELNSTLSNLDLFGNNIGDSGGQAFSWALRHNSVLSTLALYHNNIEDKILLQSINPLLTRNKQIATRQSRRATSSSASSSSSSSGKGKERV